MQRDVIIVLLFVSSVRSFDFISQSSDGDMYNHGYSHHEVSLRLTH